MAKPKTTHLRNMIIPSISLDPDTFTSTANDPPADQQPPTHDVTLQDGIITSITPCSATTSPSAPPSLLVPPLTHPHIHLDKPYLLTSHSHTHSHSQTQPPCCPSPSPSYNDLAPQDGSFPEALKFTSQAKQRFTNQDLLQRGRQLLASSYSQGVSVVRAFVEVDSTVGVKCVEAGVRLRGEFWGGNFGEGEGVGEGKGRGRRKAKGRLVRVQIVAFAQDPIFSGEHGDENRGLLEGVLDQYTTAAPPSEVEGSFRPHTASDTTAAANNQFTDERAIEVLGTTPYVESTRPASLQNIDWAVQTALRYDLHLDFHLDYHLDSSIPGKELLVWEVLRALKRYSWPTTKRRTVVLGHCSALTMLTHTQLSRLAAEIKAAQLPVYFIGLPTSDLYMMGRPASLPRDVSSEDAQEVRPLQRHRGTLLPTVMRKEYGLNVVLGVNNVGNAFTPYGTGDPLELASYSVGIGQDSTEDGVRTLFGGVSWLARDAIGLTTDGGDGTGGMDEEERGGEEEEGQQGAGGEMGRRQVGWLREGMDMSELGLLVVRNEESIQVRSSDVGYGEEEGGDAGAEVLNAMKVPARQRWSVRDVVWDAPRAELRRIVR